MDSGEKKKRQDVIGRPGPIGRKCIGMHAGHLGERLTNCCQMTSRWAPALEIAALSADYCSLGAGWRYLLPVLDVEAAKGVVAVEQPLALVHSSPSAPQVRLSSP